MLFLTKTGDFAMIVADNCKIICNATFKTGGICRAWNFIEVILLWAVVLS